MSGHSKWSSIKHQKGKTDAQRGKLFTKIAREIIVAAKMGGGSPDSNMTLRAAMQRARAVSMPQDNIKRAIARGVGGGEGANYEDLTYEGYGPGGVAVLVNCLTDNKQRTVAEVRSAFHENRRATRRIRQRGVFVFAQRHDHCRPGCDHRRKSHGSRH